MDSPRPAQSALKAPPGPRYGLLAAICGVALALRFVVPVPSGLAPSDWDLLILFTSALAGLILQPVPIGVVFITALTVGTLTKVLTVPEALGGYSNNVLWLIITAFMFARAFVKTGLGRRIALVLIERLGKNSLRLGYSLALTDLALAPVTASNTARTGAVVFPIGVSLAKALDSHPETSPRRLGAFLLFTAYQADMITAAMFLTAMASNPVAAQFASQVAGVEITWGGWLAASIVPGLISLLVVPYFIYRVYPPELKETPEAPRYARSELVKLGRMKGSEKVLVVVFTSLAILWATTQFHGVDTLVAALAGLTALLLTQVLTWNDVADEKAAWDTLLWWGGMLSLATALNQSGVPQWLAGLVGGTASGLDPIVALIAVVVAYTYAHYAFAGQTAHVVALYTPFLAVAIAAGAPAMLAALLLCFFSNLNATLTPYSSGSGPIYLGSGYIEQRDWWRVGFLISLVHLAVWLGVGLPWWKAIGVW